MKNASTFTDNEGRVYFGDSVAFSSNGVSSQLTAQFGDLPLAKIIELKDAAEVTSNERIVHIN